MLLEITLINFLLFFLGFMLSYILKVSVNILLIMMILNICSDNLIYIYYFMKVPLYTKKSIYLRILLFFISLMGAYLNRIEILFIYPLSMIFLIFSLLFKISKGKKLKVFIFMCIYQLIYMYIYVYICLHIL